MQSLRELLDLRSKLVDQMRALVDLSEQDGRGGRLSSEDDAKFNALNDQMEELSRQIEHATRGCACAS